MNHTSIDIDAQRPQAFWLLSDLHLGHGAFDGPLFHKHRDLAKAARARVLFLGDALEAVVTGSKVADLGGHYEQTGTVVDQRREFEELMKGFRVMAIVDGNHERRCTRVTGYSPLEDAAENIARQQKFPCHYTPHGCFVTINLGSQTYKIMIHHGEGGPTTLFKHLQRDFPGADLYAAGHSHQLTYEETFVHSAEGTRRVRSVRTGSYLHLPSYAADRPGTQGIPATGSWLVWLYPDAKRIRLDRLGDREFRAA